MDKAVKNDVVDPYHNFAVFPPPLRFLGIWIGMLSM
jgi:hypothetical protein